MTAVYDFFRFIKLYSTDGTTLEHTIEADAVTDTLSISRGAGVSWTPASSATDSFKIDVNYTLEVPVATTTLRLTDVHSTDQDIVLVAGTNMNIVRDSSSQLTISSLVGGISKAITSITQANPAVVQTTNVHNFTEGTPVTITDVNGMTQLNGNEYYMNVITGTTFSLYADPELTTTVDSTGFGAYTSGGVATGEYGGATKINELSDAVSDITDFGNSIMIGHNTTGVLTGAYRNTFIGLPGNSTSAGTFAAGQTITSGDDNTGIGAGALSKITSGSHNTAVGSAALGGPYSQTDFITHSYSTAVGGFAGWRSKSGNYNTLVGYSAGKDMETGGNNTAVGAIAMQSMVSGDTNVAVGYFALDNPEQGNDNVAIGARALLGNTATSPGPLRNVVIGRDAGFVITTATDNVLIGYTAGDAIATGSNNVIIGDYAGTATLADTVAIYAGSTERLTIDSTGATVNGFPIVTSSGGVTSANSISGAVTGHLIPDTNIAYDLGSSTHKFRDLYLDGSSIHLGSTILRDDGAGNLQVNLTNILQVAADDSTIRTINSGESIKFIGAGNVSTATDAEGNLTITGSTAYLPSSGGTLTSANRDILELISTSTASQPGPNITLYRDSSSVSNNDYIGAIEFKANHSAGSDIYYGAINQIIIDKTLASLESEMRFSVSNNGNLDEAVTFSSSEVKLNTEQVLKWYDHKGTTFETTLDWTTPTADRTITLPDATGTINTTANVSGAMTGHLIPTTNAAYDFGSAEYKIRHLFLSSNSLWIGDNHKVNVEGGKQKFKKRKVGIVPAGVQTLLITSVFADVAALKVSFKAIIHDPAPSNILNPDHAEFNPPTNKWLEFLASHGHPNKTVDDVYDNSTDFDNEGTDQGTTEGDIVYFDGTDYKRLPIGTAAQVLLANGSGTAPEWGDNDGGGAALTVADEGSNLTTSATTLDFVGEGVTASGTGATKTITIPGGSGGNPVNERNFKDASANSSWTVAVLSGESYYIKVIGAGGGAGSNNTGGPQTGYTGKIGGVANVEVTFLVAGTLNIDEGAGGNGGAGSGSNNGTNGGNSTVTFTPTAGTAQDFIFVEGGAGERSYGNRTNPAPDDAEMRVNNNTNWSIVRSLPTAVAEGVGTTTLVGLNTILRELALQDAAGASGATNSGAGGIVGDGANAGGGNGKHGLVTVFKSSPGGGGGSGSLTVAEEGSDLTTSASKLDFVGAGVTASGTGVTKTITISGGGGLPDAGMLETSFLVAAGDEIHYHLLGGGGGGRGGGISGASNRQGGGGQSAMAIGKVTMLKPGTISVSNPTGGTGGPGTSGSHTNGNTGNAATVTFTPDDLSGAVDMAIAGGGGGGKHPGPDNATASIGTAGTNWTEISTEAIDSNLPGSRNQRYLVPTYGSGGNSFSQGAGSGGGGGYGAPSPGPGSAGATGNAGFAWVWKR